MGEVTAAAFGLFGRDEDLKQLSDVLAHGGSALVTGEPGTGKSSLLNVAHQLGQRRGRRVLSVSPTQFDHGLPFAGLAELIAQCPPEAERSLPAPQRRALAVALQRDEPDADVDALAVPLALRGLLTHLCEVEPVALIVDDLQWMDRASVGSLGFALRHLSVDPERLSVLIGTRPDPDAGRDFTRALPEPSRAFSLRPLEDWAIGQLLRSRLGPRWTPPRSAGVARASGGNPFLALMVAQAMQSDLSRWRWSAQDGHDPVFPVPPSLAEILSEKVSLLPQSAQEVLLLVSAAGRLTVAQLEGLVDAPRVRSALDAAADWDVATVGAGSVVTFTHPMLASAIYDAARPAQRRRAHRVLADALDDPVEQARHRSRTVTAPEEPVARELERAADISRSRGAQHLAGQLFEASALASPSDDDSGVSLGRWLRAVDAYMNAGDRVAAEAALDQGSALAVAPEQQAQVLARRLTLFDDNTSPRSLAEQAVRLAPKGTYVRAQTLLILGEVHRQQGRGRLAWRVTQQAVAESAAIGHDGLQLTALGNRLAVERLWGLGHAQESLSEIEALGDKLRAHDPSSNLALAPAWAKSFYASWDDAAAEGHARNGIATLVQAGFYGDLSHLYVSLIFVLVRASRIRDAEAALDEADRLGAWTGSGLQEDMARAVVMAYAGDVTAARDQAQSAVAASRIGGSTYWLAGFLAQVGFIETSARNWPAALDALREVASIFETTRMVDLEQLLWGVDYADAALQVGALEEVETAISFLLRQGESGRPEATVAARRCQALLTAARGDVDAALSDLVRIVSEPAAECPFEAARSRLALGQVYRRAGYKGMANEALNTAASAFADLGIPRWAERARDEAGRVGLHPTTTTLTETERRVAVLVGSGRSNQETADELFVSVKTVEANLTRIYRKLSLRSRTELAHRLTELDSR